MVIVHSNGHLERYYEDCKKRVHVIGAELMMMLDKLMEDMEGDEYIYDTTEADIRMDFMENVIRLTKSPFYGQPLKLLDWQKAFISTIYGFKTEDGLNRFQRVLLLIARKNAKSETCSALLLTDMVIGGTGRDIVCSSNDDNQADILYQACDTMRLMIDPESLDTWRNQKWIRCKINDNKIFKLSDRTRAKEGRNIDVAVVDEVHEMKDNVIIKSIEQSQSLKENPLLVIITTEGFVNDGFLDAELIRARAILRDEIDDVASKHYLPWLYTMDSESEVWNGNRENRLWMKANPSLGYIKKWSYMEQQIDLAKQSKADRAFVLSKDCNIKQGNSEAWLMLEDYDYEEVFDLEEFRNCLCLGAVDLSETTDLTCAKVLLMKPDDPKKYIHTMYFIPEGKLERSDDRNAGAKYLEWAKDGMMRICEGNYLDVKTMADWFYELYRDYGLRMFMCGYDVHFATDFLARMEDYGFDTEKVNQSAEVLNQPIKMVETDLKSRLIVGNNAVDKWCLGNSSLKVDSRGNALVVKIAGQASKRIDGAVTTVILYEIYRRYRTVFETNING